eukprot:SAG31_NODE_1344_length_8699_cov_15.971512_4_plen_176_part_00
MPRQIIWPLRDSQQDSGDPSLPPTSVLEKNGRSIFDLCIRCTKSYKSMISILNFIIHTKHNLIFMVHVVERLHGGQQRHAVPETPVLCYAGQVQAVHVPVRQGEHHFPSANVDKMQRRWNALGALPPVTDYRLCDLTGLATTSTGSGRTVSSKFPTSGSSENDQGVEPLACYTGL